MTTGEIESFTAFRMQYVDGAGALTGLGYEGGAPVLMRGVNTARCATGGHPGEPAPGRWCGCGFSAATTPAPAAAYAANTVAGIAEMWRLHVEHHGDALDEVRRDHLKRAVGRVAIVEVWAGGKCEEIATEDERDLFVRVQYLQVHRVMLPANLAGYAGAIGHRYGVEVDVSSLEGRAWLEGFADGIAPSAEDLGCAMCPQPCPGRDEFPLCGMCAHRITKGYLLQVHEYRRGQGGLLAGIYS